MTSVLLSGGVGPVTLLSDTNYYLPEGELIFSANSSGLVSQSGHNNTLAIDGAVVAELRAVWLNDDGSGLGHHSVYVGPTGILRSLGVSVPALLFQDDGNEVFNHGTISGYVGVDFSFGSNGRSQDGYLENGSTGTITGSRYGVDVSGVNSVRIANAGEITGQTYGVYSWLSSDGVVINSGRIAGQIGIRILGSGMEILNTGLIESTNDRNYEAIRSSTWTEIDFEEIITVAVEPVIIQNWGTIRAANKAIQLEEAADHIRNAGIIQGDVYLGDGGDGFNGRGGTVDGVIYGEGGDDTLKGSQIDDDHIDAGNDNDMVWGRGGDDTLIGGAGYDTLLGQNGNDFLDGGGRSDVLNGGAGDDTLIGGGGGDRFVFGRSSGNDRIGDFQDGSDMIDLTALNIQNFNALNASGAISNLSGGGVAIDLSLVGGNGTLWIDGISAGQLSASDFLF